MATKATTAKYHDYDVRLMRPRLTASDLIVMVGAVAIFLAGWAVKGWHDGRTNEAEAAGITLEYPRGWLPWLTMEPEVFRVISNDNPLTTMYLLAVQTPLQDVLQAVTTSGRSGAASKTGYAQLENNPAEIDGNVAVRTDYVYVEAAAGSASLPEVIRGRQIAWIKDGQLFTLALEGPESEWDDLSGRFDGLVGGVRA